MAEENASFERIVRKLSAFTLTQRREVDGWRVQVGGELDLDTARQLAESMDALAGLVVVDLADVTFIDSTGLSVLLREHRRLDDSGGRLVLRGLTSATVRLFAETGLDRVLRVEPGDASSGNG
jgi:anti-sigma B factor antagonist